MYRKIFLITILGVLLASQLSINAQAGSKVGDKAPGIDAKEWITTKGSISSGEIMERIKGRIIVVEFWATWCPPCRTSTPHLVKLYSEYKDKGVVIIGLTREDRRKDNIDKFIREMKVNYIIGTGSDSGTDYGVSGIPHAFVISPEGKIHWRGHPMGGLDKVIKDALKKYPEATK